MVSLSKRVDSIQPSTTIALKAKAIELKRKGHLIIDLSAGEANFPTPMVAKTAAIDAIKHNFTYYTAPDGVAPLKESIARKFQLENQLEYSLDQIIVTPGAKHAIYNFFQAVCQAGDEVIIPAPYWVSYPAITQLADAKGVIVPTEKTHFKLTPTQLEAAITPQTRVLILNSPSNPAGAVYAKEELKALASILKKHPKIIILSDDIYEHICWHSDGFNNIVNACPELYDRTIIVNGVSKAYAMTGWRLGYAAGPKEIIAAMKKLQSHSTTCACSIAQVAAKAALDHGKSDIERLKTELKKNHDFLYNALKNISGIECSPTDGALYCFPNVEALIKKNNYLSDVDFAEKLLKNTGVVVIPGTAFGSANFIRISYTADIKTLTKAIELLCTAI